MISERYNLVYIGTETGGEDSLSALSGCSIFSTLQIAVVPASDDEKPFHSFIAPVDGVLTVNPMAMAYNGIDLRKASRWPRQDVVSNTLMTWASDLCRSTTPKLTACGFNVRFDVNRINAIIPRLFSYRCLDLTSVALFHGLPCESVDLIDRFGDPSITGRHDALLDAMQAKVVHRKMIEHLGRAGVAVSARDNRDNRIGDTKMS